MKTKLFLLVLFISNLVVSQEDYVVDLQNPNGHLIIGDYLYFTQKTTGDGRVSRVDITQQSPTVEDVYSSFNDPIDLVYDAPNLYVLELHGGLYKMDISQSNPTPEFMLDPTGNTSNRSITMALKDNFIYISLFDEGKIVKVNTNDSFPTNYEDVLVGLNLLKNLRVKDNDLYYMYWPSNGYKLEKVDLTETNLTPVVVENSLGNVTDMIIRNNKAYIIHYTSGGNSAISEIDLNATLPTNSSTIITNIASNLTSLEIAGDKFYVAQHTNPQGKIITYTSSVLSTGNYETETPKIYPNPVSDKFNVSLKNDIIKSVSLFSVNGKEVFSKKINSSTANISTENLSAGLYLVKINNSLGTSYKKIIVK